MFDPHAIQEGEEILDDVHVDLRPAVQPNFNPLWDTHGWKPVERVGPKRAHAAGDDVFDIIEQGLARWVALLAISVGIGVAFDFLLVKGFLFTGNEDGCSRDPAFGMDVQKPDTLAFVLKAVDGKFGVFGRIELEIESTRRKTRRGIASLRLLNGFVYLGQ